VATPDMRQPLLLSKAGEDVVEAPEDLIDDLVQSGVVHVAILFVRAVSRG
jgi:hypothetical protein